MPYALQATQVCNLVLKSFLNILHFDSIGGLNNHES